MLNIQVPPFGLFFLLIFAFYTPSYSQSNRDTGQGTSRTWGVFIGVDMTHEGVGNGYSSQSASEFLDTWANYQNLDRGSSLLILNQDARKEAIQRAFEKLQSAAPQDRVIVYLSVPSIVSFTQSHTATGYLIPHDGRLNPEPEQPSLLISILKLQEAVVASPASEVLVFIDSPMSGLHASSWPPPLNEPELTIPTNAIGKHVLIAGRWGDTFFRTEDRRSPFVISIAEALKSTVADTNNDRYVTFSELSSYARTRVGALTNGYQYVQIRSYDGSRDIQFSLGNLNGNFSQLSGPTTTFQRTDSLTLSFESPSPARIFIDNKYVGNTPLQWTAAQWQDISVQIQGPGLPIWSQVLTPDPASGIETVIGQSEDRALLNIAGVPSQHEIWVNGVHERMADLEPLQLTAGNYEVTIRKGNKAVANKQLFLEPETNNQLTFGTKFSVSPPLASLLVSGLGQYTQDARLKGAGFAVATYSAFALSLINNLEYQDNRDLFFEARENYLRARTPVQAGVLSEEMLAQYDKVVDSNNRRKNLLIAAIAFQGLSVLDALIFHSRTSVLRFENRASVTPFFSTRDDGMGMGLRINL